VIEYSKVSLEFLTHHRLKKSLLIVYEIICKYFYKKAGKCLQAIQSSLAYPKQIKINQCSIAHRPNVITT